MLTLLFLAFLLVKKNYAAVCENNFPLSGELQQNIEYEVIGGRQYIFHTIEFGCTANITKWIYLGRLGIWQPEIPEHLPELQVWEQSGQDFILQSSTGLGSVKLPIQTNAQGYIEYIPINPVPVKPGQVVGLLIRSRTSPLSSVDMYFIRMPHQISYYFTETESYQTLYDAPSGPNGNKFVPQLSAELCYPGSVCSTSSIPVPSMSTVHVAAATDTSNIPVITTQDTSTSTTAFSTSSLSPTYSITSTSTSTASTSSPSTYTSIVSFSTSTVASISATSSSNSPTVLASTAAMVTTSITISEMELHNIMPSIESNVLASVTNGFEQGGQELVILAPLMISIIVGATLFVVTVIFFVTIIICILLKKSNSTASKSKNLAQSTSTAELRYVKHSSERGTDSMCTNLAYNEDPNEIYDIINNHLQNGNTRRGQSEPIDIVGSGGPHTYNVPRPVVATTPIYNNIHISEQPNSYEVPTSSLPRSAPAIEPATNSLVLADGAYATPNSRPLMINKPTLNEQHRVIPMKKNLAYK